MAIFTDLQLYILFYSRSEIFDIYTCDNDIYISDKYENGSDKSKTESVFSGA